MGRLSANLEIAAKNAEALARSLQRASETSGPSGGGGGGGGDAGATSGVTFVTNVHLPTQTRGGGTVSGGPGSGGGGGSYLPGEKVDNAGFSDEFLRFLRVRGVYQPNAVNRQTIHALMREFEFLLKKAGNMAVTLRSGGGG